MDGLKVLAHETRTLVRFPNGKLAVVVRLYNGHGELLNWRIDGRVEEPARQSEKRR